MDYTLEDAAASASVLGTLFYFDPDTDRCAQPLSFLLDPDAAGQWPGADDADRHAFAVMQRNAQAQEESLHEAFSRLLVGPNRLPAPPWGSVYTDHDSVIFGDTTLAVRQWMRESGVKMKLTSREPEDHFGLMLIMTSWALAEGVSEEDIRTLLEQHLLPWAPRFLELFTEGAAGTLYEGLGLLAASTLDKWTEAFALTPAARKLYR